MTDTSTALAIIEEKNIATYFKPSGLDPVIEEIRKQATSVISDISTKAGRDEIRSRAAKVAKTKVALDEIGKKLTEDQKKAIKAVDAERARAWDALEALQKEIRAPLTEWENKDKARIAAHEAALAAIPEHSAFGQAETAEKLAARLAHLESLPAREWEEFKDRAAKVLADEIARTKSLLAAAQKREAEAAELARLRQEEAARKQREHEERLKAEAAELARKEAEQKARQEAEAAAAKVKAEQEAAEQERQRIQREAEAAAAREQAAKREAAEAEARAKQAEQDRLDAIAKAAEEQRATEERWARERAAAKERAERDAEAAAQAERDRIEAEKKAEANAAAKREADKAHRAKINREAADAIRSAGIEAGDISDAAVKAIVVAIAKGLIPHVRISY